ncbi:B12-binding domain-containing radical SAM protein [Nocardia wallacei]|uniref:B12-binding domain-containing radical SAM protein n=1 Tax=Nocardia wallacei TaxID=480035 RepID=UPI00245646DE|nr:cobalamin-dependent protein [Nocardia wallacei]
MPIPVSNDSGPVVVLATPAPVTHRTAEENLGLGYLAAVLRQTGYRVVVIDGWLAGLDTVELARQITAANPVLVGFACYRSNMESALDTATRVRDHARGVPIIAGGFGPSFHPEDFLSAGFDVVVRGEGEHTIVELAHHYTGAGHPSLHDIAGISFATPAGPQHNRARPTIPDLDTLPFPARDTLELTTARSSLVHVQSSRGCQASCTFCSIVAFERLAGKGPTWRQRSITGFAAELEHLHTLGVRHVKVIDDSLIEPPRDASWCAELADELDRRGVSMCLRGSIRADRATPAVLTGLARAGFWSFSCGIENFAPTALARMAKRADLTANREALAQFARLGIYVQAGHILFDHATTLDELEQNWAGMTAHDWTISKGVFTEMYAATGTNLTRRLDRQGLLGISDTRTPGTAGLGNHAYQVADPAARVVRAALKRWQKSHTRVYDETIDPLSAPKAIAPIHRPVFGELSIALRRTDLDFFRAVLDLAADGASETDAIEFTDARIADTSGWYQRLAQRTAKAYRGAGLIYDGQDNPFLC